MSIASDTTLLAAIDAQILSIVSGGVQSKSSSSGDAAGKSLTKLNLTELNNLRDKVSARLARANGAGGGFVKTRFRSDR